MSAISAAQAEKEIELIKGDLVEVHSDLGGGEARMGRMETDIRDLKDDTRYVKELLGHAPNLATGCPGSGMAAQLAHLVDRDNRRGRAWSNCKRFAAVALSVIAALGAWVKFVWQK